MPTQSSAEHQLGTSCLRRQEHQTRQMAHKSWRCVHSVDGRPSSGEHTVSRWAEGASAQQHEPWTHYHSDWETAWCHRGRIRRENTEDCFRSVTMFALSKLVSQHFKVWFHSVQELVFLLCLIRMDQFRKKMYSLTCNAHHMAAFSSNKQPMQPIVVH